jgi:ribonuclease HII
VEAGCDEAGRGCLAGPVFAAAVILPDRFQRPDLNDSKQLSQKSREALRRIIEREAIAIGIAMVSEAEIDRINILNASILAMHRALDQLTTAPEHILVDGNRFRPYRDISHTCIVKGDSKFSAIAAASVLAKTYRDEYMENLHLQFPQYGWDKNKGYPTSAHRKALVAHGPTQCHRRSFRLFNEQMRLDFF